MLEYRLRLFACYFVAAFFCNRMRHLYLDSCGPMSRYETGILGPCSEGFSAVYAVAVMAGVMMILKLAAPEFMAQLFERRPPS